MILNRRSVVIGSGALLAAGSAQAQDDGLTLAGRFVQGGHALGRTWPRALIFVDGESLTAASADGVFIVGFDREAAGTVQIEARLGDRTARRILDIAPGQFPSTSVNGLPPSTVARERLLGMIREDQGPEADVATVLVDVADQLRAVATRLNPNAVGA